VCCGMAESVEAALTGHLELAEQLRLQLLSLQTSLERPVSQQHPRSVCLPDCLSALSLSLSLSLSVRACVRACVPVVFCAGVPVCLRPPSLAICMYGCASLRLSVVVCLSIRPSVRRSVVVLISRVVLRSSDTEIFWLRGSSLMRGCHGWARRGWMGRGRG
jgi:hypothetical protein